MLDEMVWGEMVVEKAVAPGLQLAALSFASQRVEHHAVLDNKHSAPRRFRTESSMEDAIFQLLDDEEVGRIASAKADRAGEPCSCMRATGQGQQRDRHSTSS